MQESLETSIPTAPEPTPGPRRTFPLVAWIVIGLALLAQFVLIPRYILPHLPQAPAPAEAPPAEDETLPAVLLRVQGRYVVGVAHLGLMPPNKIAEQIQALNTGEFGQRLRYAILVGELQGPEEALRDLADLKPEGEDQTSDADLLDVLRRLYRDYARQRWQAPGLTDEDRDLIHHRLGWYGDLALAPKGDADGPPDPEARQEVMKAAHRTAAVLLTLTALAGMFALLGFPALFVLGVLVLSGRVRNALATDSGHGGVYAETFALWLSLFTVLAVVRVGVPAEWRLALSGIVSLLSLVVLAWPVLRGVPWRQVRQDVGLTWGRRPWVELLLGPACYIMALPLVFLGALLMLLLMRIQQHLQGGEPAGGGLPSNLPSHPIVHVLLGSDWWVRLQILLLASGAAPLVEETLFRGVLYRHLRDTTRGLGRLVSILGSALLVSFLFAAIHPQGWLAIPPLMSLALVFNLVREWRGTLVPSMIAHGLNNGLVLMLGILLLGK